MDNELYHYGVAGMRWGIRKIRKVATSNNKPRNKKEAEKYKQAKKLYSETQNIAKNLKSTTNWTKRQKERIAFNMLKGDSQKRAEGKENTRMEAFGILGGAAATAAIMAGSMAANYVKSVGVKNIASKGANAVKNISNSLYKTRIIDVNRNVISKSFKSAGKDINYFSLK